MTNALHEAEKLLASMTRNEKAQLLEWVAHDLSGVFPGIVSHPDVCGGDACIVRTRIPVWVLEAARGQGLAEAEILTAYPTLRAEDLAEAWGYVRSHKAEIDEAIRANEERAMV
ncbi:MAG TPA: DUF433 domain-containing protein [Planctomycetota bacterium]|jgi:uncharacterized protein (DUF433 family)